MYKRLFDAAQSGDMQVVRNMVCRGVDVNARDRDGNTALHLAAKYGHAAIVEFLVSQGADVNAANKYDETPLHWAARNGHAAIVEYLVSKSADVSAVNIYGDTPLHWAADNGNAAIVAFLVSNGADLNASNNNGDTALIWAAYKGHADIASFLESAAQRLSPVNGADRRSAVLALISENDPLRSRLGIKPGLEFKSDFDVGRLVEMAVKKREATDPNLRADVEAEIDFQIEAAKMLCDDKEFGNTMRPWRR